jgi:hypothetical protein
MKLKLFVYSVMGAVAIPFASADGGGKIIAPEVAAEETLGGTISAGYMSNYVFYGVDLGGNAVWTGVDYEIPNTPLTVGVWYVNPTDGLLDDELDVFATLSKEIGGFDTSLTMTGYFYPDAGADATYELTLGIGRSLGFVDWTASARYDFEIEGWFFETGISKGIKLCDKSELVIGAGIGYQIDYWTGGGEFNHAYLIASLPYKLSSRVTLEPYVAGLFALDAVDSFQDDIIHGGVSLSVSF